MVILREVDLLARTHKEVSVHSTIKFKFDDTEYRITHFDVSLESINPDKLSNIAPGEIHVSMELPPVADPASGRNGPSP